MIWVLRPEVGEGALDSRTWARATGPAGLDDQSCVSDRLNSAVPLRGLLSLVRNSG